MNFCLHSFSHSLVYLWFAPVGLDAEEVDGLMTDDLLSFIHSYIHSLIHLGFSPVGLDAEEVDRLMTDELLRPLLHDLLVIQRAHHLHF